MKEQITAWFTERGIKNFDVNTSFTSDALLVRMKDKSIEFYASTEISPDADSKDVDFLLTELVERFGKGPDWAEEFELRINSLENNMRDMSIRLAYFKQFMKLYRLYQAIPKTKNNNNNG